MSEACGLSAMRSNLSEINSLNGEARFSPPMITIKAARLIDGRGHMTAGTRP